MQQKPYICTLILLDSYKFESITRNHSVTSWIPRPELSNNMNNKGNETAH